MESSRRPGPSTSPSSPTHPAHPSAQSCRRACARWKESGSGSLSSSAARTSSPTRPSRPSCRIGKPRARRREQRRPGARAAGDRRCAQRARRLVPDAVARARGDLPPRVGAHRRPVALHAQRGDDAQPVEDRAPVGDRCGLRDDRLLALQRRLRHTHLLGAAALADRDLEPDGVPTARGLRLRGQPVQLHLHRRQSLELAGAHGQYGDLEARVHCGALRLLPHADHAGGRVARRRHQPRLRVRRDDRQRRSRKPGAGRHPLHGLDRGLQQHVGDGRQERRLLPQLPAHRGRDRRQGLHPRPSVRRRRGRRYGGRPRVVRVPGTEVLGCLAAVRAVEPLAPGQGAAGGGRLDDQDGRSRPTSRTSWAP